MTAHATGTVEVREELPRDASGIRAVNEAAFEQPAEAALVDALRTNDRVAVSLVAVREGRIVAHLLLSRAMIKGRSTTTDCLALAPMAVVPELQRQRIGTQLVETALNLARERGHGIVVVLGHPDYYPRFGFERASTRNIRTDYDAPDEAFMVLGLRPGALDSVEGVVEYSPEFDAV